MEAGDVELQGGLSVLSIRPEARASVGIGAGLDLQVHASGRPKRVNDEVRGARSYGRYTERDYTDWSLGLGLGYGEELESGDWWKLSLDASLQDYDAYWSVVELSDEPTMQRVQSERLSATGTYSWSLDELDSAYAGPQIELMRQSRDKGAPYYLWDDRDEPFRLIGDYEDAFQLWAGVLAGYRSHIDDSFVFVQTEWALRLPAFSSAIESSAVVQISSSLGARF